jgi:hypothetical protein
LAELATRNRGGNRTEEAGINDDQRHARIFGVLFIITFLTSIPALALFQPVLDDPAAYIAGDGKDNQIYLGALLEFFLILANVGTAVGRRHHRAGHSGHSRVPLGAVAGDLRGDLGIPAGFTDSLARALV